MEIHRHRFRSGLLPILGAANLLCAGLAWPAEPAPSQRDLEAALGQGVGYLRSRQRADGAWPSEAYGALKPGAATSALVAEMLSRLPAAQDQDLRAALLRACAFLTSQQGPEGGVGTVGSWPEYPGYATALALRALVVLKPPGWEARSRIWLGYLKAQQHTAAGGCRPEEPAFGGWSAVGAAPPGFGRRADLSTTRFVLEACLQAGLPGEDPLWRDALVFVLRCQDPRPGGGGFLLSLTHRELNKTAPELEDPQARAPSYGSATADGWRCLQILEGVGVLGPRRHLLEAARDWFPKGLDWSFCPGFAGTPGASANWDRALVFYYRASRANAERQQPQRLGPLGWRALAREVLAAQRKDGSWQNEQILMKEDDPLIATTFAMQALLHCLEVLRETSQSLK